MYALSVAK